MRQNIRDLKEGDVVDEFYAIQQCDRRETKQGKSFLTLVLTDATGSVSANLWDDVDRLQKIFESGKIVKITGKVGTYEGKPQIKISDGRSLRPGDKINESDVRMGSVYDPEEMWRELEEYRLNVKDPYVAKLLASFFEDPEFIKEFKVHTAAKAMHHAACGGLLEHTLGVTRLVLTMAERYPKLNRDLLTAGAMLHDVGKLYEMQGSLSTEYTTLGRLIGHVAYGSELVGKACDKIEGFPEELRLQLQHMILSHHGRLEFGSPVLPQTPEAMALFRADETDSHLYMVFKAIGEEGEQPGDFTSRVKALETALYKTEAARKGGIYSMAYPAAGKKTAKPAPEQPAPEPAGQPAEEKPGEEPAAQQWDLFFK